MLLRIFVMTGLLLMPSAFSSAWGADLDRRPCGPDAMVGPLRLLVPQGFAGADFRPACRRHDACYDTYGSVKAQCDQQFLRDMQAACSNSRFPRLCRCMARAMHQTTSRRGVDAFVDAQRIALGLLTGRR